MKRHTLLLLVLLCFGGCRLSESERDRTWRGHLIALDDRLADLQARCRHAGEKRVPGVFPAAQAKPGDGSDSALRAAFREARLEYKRLEFLWEAVFPAQALALNDPAPDEPEAGSAAIVSAPGGFLGVEAALFPARSLPPEAVSSLAASMRVVLREPGLRSPDWTDSALMEATRIGLLRVSALGLTGFDSPLARHSLPEAHATLAGMDAVMTGWLTPVPEGGPSEGRVRWQTAILPALAALNPEYGASGSEGTAGFDAFDRASFLARRLDPLYASLLDWRDAAGIPVPREAFAYSPRAAGLFAPAWDASFFAPVSLALSASASASPALVDLGRKLFFDPALSAHGERSCASCHLPERGFGDGLIKGPGLVGHGPLDRHTPSLLLAGFQNALFWDERAASLEEQVEMVVRNPREMGGSLDIAAAAMRTQTGYRPLFKAAFQHQTALPQEASPETISRALAAYIRSLAPLDSPWDRYMRGDSAAMTAEARHGFNLFMGKAQCATCHFPPLFNGSVPPLYGLTEVEVIGVPASMNPAVLDGDFGRMAIDQDPRSMRAFKTPTVRNAEFTAPYMHNGVFATLEEVIDFYDAGGGAGLGLDVPNQTLPPDSLRLSGEEKRALIGFIKALSDTTGTLPPRPRPLPSKGRAARAYAGIP